MGRPDIGQDAEAPSSAPLSQLFEMQPAVRDWWVCELPSSLRRTGYVVLWDTYHPVGITLLYSNVYRGFLCIDFE